jgi:hypothetical protein
LTSFKILGASGANEESRFSSALGLFRKIKIKPEKMKERPEQKMTNWI